MTDSHQMLHEIAKEAKETALFTGRGYFSGRVMHAIGKEPRDRFVPDGLVIEAYENTALPIGFEQTISQPYVVALMTDLLDVSKEHCCLEVGTGSGYQAAVLSQLVRTVYTVEIIAPLFRYATERLHALDYRNVQTILGDGNVGCAEHAPYDRIIVTAAAEVIPQELIDQLKAGGRMVIPVGPHHGPQMLYLVEKSTAAEIQTTAVLPVIFVPLIEPAPQGI